MKSMKSLYTLLFFKQSRRVVVSQSNGTRHLAPKIRGSSRRTPVAGRHHIEPGHIRSAAHRQPVADKPRPGLLHSHQEHGPHVRGGQPQVQLLGGLGRPAQQHVPVSADAHALGQRAGRRLGASGRRQALRGRDSPCLLEL